MIVHSLALVLLLHTFTRTMIRKQKIFLMLALMAFAPCAQAAFSLVMTNGYGDVYRMNLLRDRENYQCYRGICSYRGFSLSGCSTTGEVVMLRIKGTPSMPEYSSILSTSLRWGTTQYVLNDLFHPLCSWVQAGYENWYPFDMSCSVAMYINSGGYGTAPCQPNYGAPDPLGGSSFSIMTPEDRSELGASLLSPAGATSYSLVMSNGYGDVYRMNLLRDRENYQCYRGICSYRGFSLSGCSTTGEVVMLRIKGTPSMPEHFSLVSTSLRWGTTMYFLNDVFRPLNAWVMAGYENWYPFDMSCSVAMYINSGGVGVQPFRSEPLTALNSDTPFTTDNGTGTNLIGVLLPLTGDLADTGLSYQSAINQALSAITNTHDMPLIRVLITNTSTDAAIAYEQLVELRSNGCHIVLGPESSEECRILKTYANLEDVLLLSSSSTATPLSLPGDNLMRLTIDDSNQARVLAGLLASNGITDIAILSRSDIYGEGFLPALIQEHNARGGTVFATNYCPRATDLIPETVSNMAVQVSARSAIRGVNRVGVVTILFDEGVEVLQQAAAWPALYSVRWYGTDGMAQNRSLATNALASEMAAYVGYTCPAFGRFTNTLYGAVEARIGAELGVPVVPRYPMSSYDALWLATLAIKQTGGTNTMAELIAAIHSVATNYEGCTSPIIFNDADDRATGTYDIWLYTASGWVLKTNRASSISHALNDYDGDGKSDLAMYREGYWSIYSRVLAGRITQGGWGASGWTPVPGDYDGDGKADIAVYHNGYWSICTMAGNVIQGGWGAPDAIPVSGDYDGDRKSDVAVYRDGYWSICTMAGNVIEGGWGSPGWIPVSGDYDGDHKSDVSVYRDGYWSICTMAGNVIEGGWGSPGWIPVSGDYDGDHKSDVSVYRDGYWSICTMAGSVLELVWGGPGWIPVQ
ncbi:MAG: ABC transporter substrate-binding protein [Kiritimatiellae bacterium]|nr:ABC transporter substrate-binding protein [Kiritimatiellia bacterium]